MTSEEKRLAKEEKQIERMRKRNEKREARKASGKVGILTEFKNFISRGSVVDMAVGVVIATAFTAIINSIVKDIIMPIVALALPKGGVENLQVALPGAVQDPVTGLWDNAINYGNLISAVMTFLIVAVILFAIIKIVSVVRQSTAKIKAAYEKKMGIVEPVEAEAAPAATNDDIVKVLEEIRNELKQNNQHKDK